MTFETLLVISSNFVNVILEFIIHSSQFSSCFHGKVFHFCFLNISARFQPFLEIFILFGL